MARSVQIHDKLCPVELLEDDLLKSFLMGNVAHLFSTASPTGAQVWVKNMSTEGFSPWEKGYHRHVEKMHNNAGKEERIFFILHHTVLCEFMQTQINWIHKYKADSGKQ